MILAGVSLPLTATAQDTIPPGSWIRVTDESGGTITGELRSLPQDDRIALVVDGREHELRHDATARIELGIERSAGQGFLRGAGIGALIGGLGGAALVFAVEAVEEDKPCTDACIGTGAGALIVGVVLGAPAALIGGLIGASSPGYRWRDVTSEFHGLTGGITVHGPGRVELRLRWTGR